MMPFRRPFGGRGICCFSTCRCCCCRTLSI